MMPSAREGTDLPMLLWCTNILLLVHITELVEEMLRLIPGRIEKASADTLPRPIHCKDSVSELEDTVVSPEFSTACCCCGVPSKPFRERSP